MPTKQRYPVINGIKRCSKCLLEKPVGDFYFAARKVPLPSCKTCCKAAVRQYEKRNPEKKAYAVTRKYYHKYYYGLDHGAYEVMLAKQNFVCAICKSTKSRRGKDEHFCIDHCHSTGKVRGLLCHHCNMAIGFFRDDPEILRVAAEYLEAQLVIDSSSEGGLKAFVGTEVDVNDGERGLFTKGPGF